MSVQLILELNDQNWDDCFKIIECAREFDKDLGYKILPITKIECTDCRTELTQKFVHYTLQGRLLCGNCRKQYDDKGRRKD